MNERLPFARPPPKQPFRFPPPTDGIRALASKYAEAMT
jgi:hypothetical protein